jgi:hypothetical protein
MNNQASQAKTYDWSQFDARMAARGESIYGWAKRHGFNRKTVYALRHNRITWGIGPKVQAIIDAALADGLVDEVKDEDCPGHGPTVAEQRPAGN